MHENDQSYLNSWYQIDVVICNLNSPLLVPEFITVFVDSVLRFWERVSAEFQLWTVAIDLSSCVIPTVDAMREVTFKNDWIKPVKQNWGGGVRWPRFFDHLASVKLAWSNGQRILTMTMAKIQKFLWSNGQNFGRCVPNVSKILWICAKNSIILTILPRFDHGHVLNVTFWPWP